MHSLHGFPRLRVMSDLAFVGFPQGHRDPGFLNPGFENCLGGPGHLDNFTVKREKNGGAICRGAANCTDLCGRRPLYLHKDGVSPYIYIYNIIYMYIYIYIAENHPYVGKAAFGRISRCNLPLRGKLHLHVSLFSQ